MTPLAKWTGPALMGGIALIGAWSAFNTNWRLDTSFEDGVTQEALQDRFDDALVIREGAIDVWGHAFWSLFGQTSDGAVPGKDGWLFTNEEYRASPGFEARLSASVAAIVDARSALQAQGQTLVIALIPDKARIYDDHLARPRAPAVTARYDALLDQLTAHGIEPLDLRPALQEARMDADVFLRTDTHWTPFGAQTVAKAIVPQIAALGLETTGFETEIAEEIPHTGDLMRYLPLIAPEAAGFGPQTLTRYTTVTAGGDLLGGADLLGGGGLFGDAPGLASLIGTSFSANPNWHFDGWLKQETGVDLINRADEGQGPFAPMRTYLADADALSETTAGLVIWEIPERYTTLEQ